VTYYGEGGKEVLLKMSSIEATTYPLQILRPNTPPQTHLKKKLGFISERFINDFHFSKEGTFIHRLTNTDTSEAHITI